MDVYTASVEDRIFFTNSLTPTLYAQINIFCSHKGPLYPVHSLV